MENKFLDNIKTIFQRKVPNASEGTCDSPKPITLLSSIANSVVYRCCKILKISSEELQISFDKSMPEMVKQRTLYARHLLEFCSYKALNILTARPDYLREKDFRRLMYDMMLAWETPDIDHESAEQVTLPDSQGVRDDDGWSLFYSSSTDMAVQVDDKKTVGVEAFTRIAPACAAIADVVTVQNLFDALTLSSGQRLHFLIYDKYLQSLDKVTKGAKSMLGALSNLGLAEGEIVLDIDGSVPTQPVLQHIGISAWPGRLTLTTNAFYFESLGVGVYDKAVRYDLSKDLKQVIKPELTGPLGARLFDKAVLYRSTLVTEPLHFEFPEFKGNTRRDYWLDVYLEILHAHRFVRKNGLKGTQKSELIARAVLGIFRCRAVREAFHIYPSKYKTLLLFNLAENLPGGDLILETLLSRLQLLNVSGETNASESMSMKQGLVQTPVSLLSLQRLGLIIDKSMDCDIEVASPIGYVTVGEVDLLESAVKQSKTDSGKAEAAKATVDQVKVDGIDTNLAVMKELLFPFVLLGERIQFLASWEDPLKSVVFLLLTGYIILSRWLKFILPSILLLLAGLMLWRRHTNKGKPVRAFRITPPPNRNAVEQLLTLQEAVSQVEVLIQTGNVILLKIRALLFAVLPQATERVAVALIITALVFAFVPLRVIVLSILTEIYTREMPFRRDSTYKWVRRVREWWFRIPAAPVQLIKPEESKKKK
ncbi:hypothetical protein V2J09_011615 [Rumex salicifolius]